VALIVMDVETRSTGIPSKRSWMSSDGRDRDPDFADLTARDRRVGVIAHLGREVEGHRKPGLPLVAEGNGSACSSPSPSRSPRTAAWSRTVPRYIVGMNARVNRRPSGNAEVLAEHRGREVVGPLHAFERRTPRRHEPSFSSGGVIRSSMLHFRRSSRLHHSGICRASSADSCRAYLKDSSAAVSARACPRLDGSGRTRPRRRGHPFARSQLMVRGLP